MATRRVRPCDATVDVGGMVLTPGQAKFVELFKERAPRVTVLRGEPGVGKDFVATALCRRDDDLMVAPAAGGGPIADVLRRALCEADPDAVARIEDDDERIILCMSGTGELQLDETSASYVLTVDDCVLDPTASIAYTQVVTLPRWAPTQMQYPSDGKDAKDRATFAYWRKVEDEAEATIRTLLRRISRARLPTNAAWAQLEINKVVRGWERDPPPSWFMAQRGRGAAAATVRRSTKRRRPGDDTATE